MIQCVEKADQTPLCPHCSQPIGTLLCREIAGWLGRRYLYYCSNCQKALGISHRKGFWMG